MGLLARMFGWERPGSAIASAAETKPRTSFWSSTERAERSHIARVADYLQDILNLAPAWADGAADDLSNGSALKLRAQPDSLPEVLANWYASQSFIGWQMCAILAQHWLIDKACAMPARDAIRKGFEIVNVDGDDIDAKALKALRRADRAMRLNWNCEQLVRMGRIFGMRVVLFKVESTDPEYYEKPFNPDGVTPGSYKGMVQVDPYWMSPQLDQAAASQPDTQHFYEPTWWQINGRRYHRSHLVIFRNGELADIMKPAYMYGGVPVPQRIMERVYAAERVANEAPELAQSKRTTVWLTDLSKVLGNDEAIGRLNEWTQFRNNYAVKLGDSEGDQIEQFDTSLTDLDTVIMTQYQIVAAAANVPATKLLGTTPKGFSATGEYEEASYHEELESIQAHDLTPLVERHHLLVIRSQIPALKDVETTVEWRPLDSPTAKEQAETNLTKAQTGAALVASGAIASEEERQRVANDPAGGYAGVDLSAPAPEPEDDLDDDGDESSEAQP